MEPYWFFLSYARNDSREYIKKFYENLAEEVRIRGVLSHETPIEQVGFFDARGIKIGEEWPEAISAALQNSRTLVCLYSRNYFAGSYCGKEFEVFRQRIEKGRAASSLIMPIFWDEPADLRPLPPAVAKYQHSHLKLGKGYEKLGLRRIITLNKYQDDYQEFIFEFARQLEKQAEESFAPPLEKLPPLSAVPNPFAMPDTVPHPSSTPDIKVGSGMAPAKSKGVHFYIFAGSKTAMTLSLKTHADAYGDHGHEHEWQPFYPKVKEPAGLIAQGEAIQAKLISQICCVDDNFITQLTNAENENIIVFLLIDPWTVRLEPYNGHLREYDKKRLINCGALVIWNEQDPEMPAHSTGLKKDMHAALIGQVVSRDPTFWDSINSVDNLREGIRKTISEIQKRLIKRGRVLRAVPEAGVRLPSISGSGRN